MLGEILKHRRRAQGLTKADLELLTGVSVKTIRRIESGNEGVSYGSVVRVAIALGGEVRFGEKGNRREGATDTMG